jgi:xeroderma pigmentosum group C-complementing protein
VLARHLTKTQTIHPPPPQTRELGKFRGEPVYPRSAVVSLKTAENWMRSEGRQIKEGEQPMKWVKMQASTIWRKREMEAMREGLRIAGEHAEAEAAAANGDDDGGDGGGDGGPGESSAKKIGQGLEKDVMQGLYALSQTELYVAAPVVDVSSSFPVLSDAMA